MKCHLSTFLKRGTSDATESVGRDVPRFKFAANVSRLQSRGFWCKKVTNFCPIIRI